MREEERPDRIAEMASHQGGLFSRFLEVLSWHFISRSGSTILNTVYTNIYAAFVILSVVSLILSLKNAELEFNHYSVYKASTSTNILEEQDNVSKKTERTWFVIDIVCLVFFMYDYILRFLAAPVKVRYVFSLMSLIDILAIVPEIIARVVGAAVASRVGVVSILGKFFVARVLRILRLMYFIPEARILAWTLRTAFIDMIAIAILMAVAVMTYSSLFFMADLEHEHGIKTFDTAFWLTLVTMTTVGYGDVIPMSYFGKVVGCLCAATGVLITIMTVSMLVKHFSVVYKNFRAIQMEASLDRQRKNMDTDRTAVPTAYGPSSEQELVPMVTVTTS